MKQIRKERMRGYTQHVRSAYQPPASSTFLSEQTSHQQSASSTFLSEQISTSHQPNEQADCGKAVDLSEMLVAARSHPNKYGSLTAP
jgi:hypothetical protein